MANRLRRKLEQAAKGNGQAQPIALSEMPTDTLKARAYDVIELRDRCTLELERLNQEIASRRQNVAVPAPEPEPVAAAPETADA